MNYQEFQEQIMENIKEYLPESYADSLVHIQQVQKNNGVLLDGLNIVLPEENVSPTIYLNDYYKHYRAGREMEDILQAESREAAGFTAPSRGLFLREVYYEDWKGGTEA